MQASAVPCERIFSSAKETTTLRRARLTPPLMEVLQILKFTYRRERLDFASDWIANEEELLKDVPNISSSVVQDLLTKGLIDDLVNLLGGGVEGTDVHGALVDSCEMY